LAPSTTSPKRGKKHLDRLYTILGLETSSHPQEALGRICLLKGCGKRFIPRPQDRLRAKYHNPDCRKKAARWRSWLRRKERRRSREGKKAKRRENQRHREKHPDYRSEYRRRNGDRVRAIERASKKRRRAKDPQDCDVHKGVPCCHVPCHRPGCYRLFVTAVALAGVRRYCGQACRETMRRYSALLAQLRYRRTSIGNYRRKIARSGTRPPPGGPPPAHSRL